MKKSVVFATVAAAMLLAGCGKTPVSPVASQMTAQAAQANATKTLLTGFKHIHMAIFTKLDQNEDGQLDEYEASTNITLKDFQSADKNKNGKLTKTEFINFATEGSVFSFLRQNKNAFMKQTRDVLGRAFQRLDADSNRVVTEKELSDKALTKAGINLRIDGLRTKVMLTELDDAVFESSDKTGDGALSQAEFEDYCVTAFVKGLNPAYNMGGTPAPAPDPGGDEPPADEDS